MTEEVLELLRSGGTFGAIERIQLHATPLEIASRYQTLVKDLYWKAHDLPAVVTIGRAGLYYCLGMSVAPGASAELLEKLRSAAKAIAYNIGSFTWPGWEEPGINPTAEDLAFGRECAALNLRLAIELNKPADKVSMAHWLVGAHALAAGEFESAAESFRRAQDVLPADHPSAKAMAPCNLGYVAVARLCANPADADAHSNFERITGELQSQSDEDSKTYLSQLLSARRVFSAA